MNVQDSLKIFAYDDIIAELYSLREVYSEFAEDEQNKSMRNLLYIIISDLSTLINKYEIDPMTMN